nr:MAG TPA: repressor domain protein [Caudoviricetes sp.]
MTDITTNSTQIFSNPEFGKVRVIEKDGEPWFVGKDVADILGYQNGSRDINHHVDEENKALAPIQGTPGETQQMTIISEYGLYSLVLSSKMPNAKKFRHWIASEIKHKMHRSHETDADVVESAKSAIQIFENPEFGKMRVIEKDGEPWFIANEVARALGYTNPSKATNDHCKHSEMWWDNDSLGRPQRFKIIPESDLYRLAAKSKLPGADRFESWVFDEVIPSIRKHGGYIAGQNEMSDMELLSRALLLVKNQLDDRNRQIEEMQPKVIFADAVETSSTSVLIGDFAKLLKQNGIDIGQTRLFEWLRNNGYLMRVKGERRNMPTQRSMEMKLFEIKESVIEHKDGHLTIIRTPKVTGKGQIYFANKFLQDRFLQE